MSTLQTDTRRQDFILLRKKYEQVRLDFLKQLIEKLPTPEQQDDFKRRIFDASRQVGLEQTKAGDTWTTKKIALFLQHSDFPCYGGKWEQLKKGHWQWVRTGSEESCHPVCEYWHESLDGLVMGLGDTTRYARHLCRSHGDEQCMDVLYDSPLYDLRWGKIPSDIQAHLNTLESTLAQHQFTVEWMGYATGTLYFKLHDHHPHLAGHRYPHLVKSIAHEVQGYRPNLKTQEVSPRAVWQGD